MLRLSSIPPAVGRPAPWRNGAPSFPRRSIPPAVGQTAPPRNAAASALKSCRFVRVPDGCRAPGAGRSFWLRRLLICCGLTLCGLALVPGAGRADITVAVPLEHPVYEFLERCMARGQLRGVRYGVRPFSRQQVASALVQADTARAAQPLSRIENDLLQQYLKEFAVEVRAVRGEDPAPMVSGMQWHHPLGPAPLFTLAGNQSHVHGDVIFRHQMDTFDGMDREDPEWVFRSSLGGEVHGQIAGMLGFSSSFKQTMEYGTRDYRIRDDVFESRLEVPQLKGSHVDYHEGRATLVASVPRGSLELGKGVAAWGPAPDDNLGLGGNTAGFNLVRLRLEFSALTFVSLHGSLRPCPARPDSPVCWGTVDSVRTYIVSNMSRIMEKEKYLAAHRLELSPSDWLTIGVQEFVIYGDRRPELAYINPVMFYWAAQSYLGDKDNLLMGFDVDIRPGHGLRAYAAYVIDDMQKLKIFSDDFVNKFSIQAGFTWVDPPGLRDADLGVDYVRIEPWVYTHKFPINTFRHFDMPLGHALGPNSDRWVVRLRRRMRSNLEVDMHCSRTRHGANILREDGSVLNVGGDLHLGWRVGDEREIKEFLKGNLSRRTEIGAGVRWRIWPRVHLNGAVAYQWGNNVPLPPRWDPDTSVGLRQRTGYGDADQLHLRFDVRYGLF